MSGRKLPILLRLIVRGGPYWRLLLAVVGTTAAMSAAVVAAPKLIGWAIDIGFKIVELPGSDQLSVDGNMGTLTVAIGLLLAVAVSRGVVAYGQTYLSEKISQGVAYDLRNDIFDHLQELSAAYHDRAQTGQIMSRATQDVEAVRRFVSMGVVRLLYIAVLVGVSLALMFDTNVKVGLITAAFLPLIATQSIVVALWMRPIFLRLQEMNGQMSTVLQESLTGMRVVKAFSREEYHRGEFREKTEELFRNAFRASLIQAITGPSMVSIWLLASVVVFWFGGREVSAGNMSPGDLTMFQLYLAVLQAPVRQAGAIVTMFARAHASGTRIYEILDAESTVREQPGALPLVAERGEVVFEQVSFGYDVLSPVLHDVSIRALPGEVVAVLGPTGSGKSTVVNLLPRFYDVTEGAITIDGQDIRSVTLDSLRQSIGVVQQDVYLFPATIRENIAYGRPGASDEETEAAARAAHIHDFIESLPDGYETWVGERGQTLSGGQRQRVAIARTLLLDPRVLIFDDSTSSVDMRTEYLIQEALQTLMKGRTTFVIAQRLRTVQMADQILVMRDGRIVEHGTHEELLEHGGLYREIYDLELRDQEEARAAVAGDAGGE